jgi:ABC-2 type transport system permease protein
MVGVLIRMRRSVLRNSLRSTNPAWVILGAVIGLLSVAGTVVLGAVHYHRPAAGADVLAVVFGVWMLGRVSAAALNGGDGTLRPEMFRLLPISVRKLATSLLAVAFVDASLVFLLVAFGALVLYAAHYGAAVVAVAVVAVLSQVVLLVVAGTLMSGTLSLGSRRARDIQTLFVALVITAGSLAAAVLPLLAHVLTNGTAPGLSFVVRVLPSGWGAVAVDAARRSDWGLSIAALAGLLVLSGLLAAVWPTLLRRRLTAVGRSSHGPASAANRRRILPTTPLGAVLAKELRLWSRDTLRLTCLLIALFVGVLTCVISTLISGSNFMLPWAGALTALIAGACACNLYGNDGGSIWLTLTTPGAERADVRGRQLAWLLIVAPVTVVITLALTAVSGLTWAWPWVLGGMPALLGGAAGLIPLISVFWAQRLADDGSPTPAWSIQVHLMLFAIAATALPACGLVIAGTVLDLSALRWAAVPIGLATGVLLAWSLGRLAYRRLQTRGPELLATVRLAV